MWRHSNASRNRRSESGTMAPNSFRAGFASPPVADAIMIKTKNVAGTLTSHAHHSISSCRLSVRRSASAVRRPFRATFDFETIFRSFGALITFAYGDAHDLGHEAMARQTPGCLPVRAASGHPVPRMTLPAFPSTCVNAPRCSFISVLAAAIRA
jgi:hypothetical protein